MNNITVAGNIGKDAELRHLPNGDPVVNFSVADSQGRDKPTIWWRCQLFGKRAESLHQYLAKGQQVAVSGSVSERKYTDHAGAERTSMEIRVNDVALQDGRRDEAAPAPAPRPQQAPAPRQSSGFEDDDSSIPFRDPLARRGLHLAI